MSIAPYMTPAGKREAWLRIAAILTHLSKAEKTPQEKLISLERKLASELLKQWRETYTKALKKVFRAIPKVVSKDAMNLLQDVLYEELGPAFGSSEIMRALMEGSITRAYSGEKLRWVTKKLKDSAKSSFLSLPDRRAISVLTRHNCFWIGEHYGNHIGPKIAQMTQKAIDEGMGRDALAEELRYELGGVAPEGYSYWDVVSSSALVRARSFGAISGMEEAGITEYEILAMGDERMCDICGEMNGRVFSVVETRKVIDRALDITDPEAFKTALPWQTEPPIGKSSEQLMEEGQNIPPFHGRCRCTLVMTESTFENVPQASVEAEDDSIAILAKIQQLKDKRDSCKLEYDKAFNDYVSFKGNLNDGTAKAKRMDLLARSDKLSNDLKELEKEVKRAKLEAAEKGVVFATKIAESLNKTDVDAIIKLVQAAPEGIRKVWNLYEEEMKIADKSSNGAYYSPARRAVYFNIDMGRNLTPEQKAFCVVFHELGHLIDHASCGFPSDNAGRNSVLFDNGAFGDMLRKEGREYISNIKRMMQDELVQAGKSREFAKAWIGINDAQDELSRELRKIALVNRHEVSDIFHGITKGKVDGGFGHYERGYWNKPEALAKEAFAHCLSATISNPEGVENIKKYFPRAYNIFEKMISKMSEEGSI